MYDNEYNIVKMLKSGANGYVLKDTSTIELHNALISIHENSYYHSEIISGSVINMIRNGQNDNTVNDKELELLSHICSDLTYKEIGELMHVSGRTVEGYRNSLFQKLNLRTRTGLALFALKIGACK
jgi:DNA-binding NarL/FixJ family response regulator